MKGVLSGEEGDSEISGSFWVGALGQLSGTVLLVWYPERGLGWNGDSHLQHQHPLGPAGEAGHLPV